MQSALPLRPAHSFTLPGINWKAIAIACTLLTPLVLTIFLVLHPTFNEGTPDAPFQHLVVVGGASVMALLLALFLVITSARIKHYRVLFLSFGFLAYGGFSALHALTVPGIFLPASDDLYGIAGAAAYLALFFAAGFFALVQTRVATTISSRLPFLPIGWFVVSLGGGMAIFFAFAVYKTAVLARIPLSSFPYSTGTATLTIGLLGYAAFHYLKSYSITKLPLQINLAVAILLLAEAQVIILLSAVWSWSWWGYHIIAFTGIALALRSLLNQNLAGTPLRALVESALDIGVSVQFEVKNLDTLAALSTAIETRDNETAGHNERVAKLSVLIGRAMNLDNARIRVLAHAGLLHDIGKLAMPDAILRKPGPLTDEERAFMQTHPLRGLDILGKIGGFKRENTVIVAHHERIDGSGYPYGLVGDQIPIEARIIAVVDTYDAIVSDRPYRAGRSSHIAFAILRKESGIKLDTNCVDTLLQVLADPYVEI